jgi:hypothetical protein
MSSGFETETELAVHALELRMPCSEVATVCKERPPGSMSKLRTKRLARVIENPLLPAIDLVRVNAVPLRQLRRRRDLAQGLQGNLGLERGIKLLS